MMSLVRWFYQLPIEANSLDPLPEPRAHWCKLPVVPGALDLPLLRPSLRLLAGDLWALVPGPGGCGTSYLEGGAYHIVAQRWWGLQRYRTSPHTCLNHATCLTSSCVFCAFWSVCSICRCATEALAYFRLLSISLRIALHYPMGEGHGCLKHERPNACNVCTPLNIIHSTVHPH